MLTTKGVSVKHLFSWTWRYVFWLMLFNGTVATLYYFNIINLKIPWLPVSVIGTAVAFYVGFKNNNAYGRLWEARKIWGGIVNDSRAWGIMVDGFITNMFTKAQKSEIEIHEIKKRLIYRHIAWLYTHRNQLLVPTSWEHLSQSGNTKRTARYFQKNFGLGLLDDDVTPKGLKRYLPESEYERLINYANTATQIINEQSRDLRELRKENLIDDFRHMRMEDVLRSFYELQGKNERIKKFPLPRQYSAMSHYFVAIFIFLLPFSMVPEIMNLASWSIWLSIPITALVGWVYIMMEVIGDYSENPFQGLMNDIPMMSLCRTIEIDLREMLNETDLPPAIQSVKGVLN
ncbi:bestrophin family protein [Niabella insulamsoli]|uniref:bestrophin family protein n=1 Tax=Niabella insulamsoli TaxID=3144874 RepID=UPI0031FC6A8A